MVKPLKDVVQATTQGPPRWLVAPAIPICMMMGFVSVLVRQIGRAFKLAWLEAQIERDAGMRWWRGASHALLYRRALRALRCLAHHQALDLRRRLEEMNDMAHGVITDVENGLAWGTLFHGGEDFYFDIAMEDILECQRSYIEPGVFVTFPNGYLLVNKEIWTSHEMDLVDAKARHWAELFDHHQ